MSNPVKNLVEISEEDGHVNQQPAKDALTEQATQLMLMTFFLLHAAKDALQDSLRSLVQTTPNTDEEYLAFSEVFVQALTPNRPLIETILPDVDACVANETIDGCTVVLRLWLGVLRSMNPCADDNSVWRIGEGCVCAHGRHCADDEVPIKISDLWSYEVAIAIAVVCVLIRGVISYKEVTHLHREQQKLENDHVSVLKKNAQAQTSQQQQPKKRQILGMTGA